VLVAFGALFPRLRPLLWVYAILIAISRVVVSTHYPSDVIGGAVVGGFGALLIRNWFAERRLCFYVGSDHEVRPLPGPSLGRLKRVARRLLGS
jgi:undecaprenyl-diphosphatase